MNATPQEIVTVLQREFIDKEAALRYAEKIAASQSLLAGDYQEAAYLLKSEMAVQE